MKEMVAAGRYGNAQLSGERIALPGNLKPDTCVGLSTGPFAKVNVRKSGRIR
jgi:hypothetical protein